MFCLKKNNKYNKIEFANICKNLICKMIDCNKMQMRLRLIYES